MQENKNASHWIVPDLYNQLYGIIVGYLYIGGF